jgi:hypothetical protein
MRSEVVHNAPVVETCTVFTPNECPMNAFWLPGFFIMETGVDADVIQNINRGLAKQKKWILIDFLFHCSSFE